MSPVAVTWELLPGSSFFLARCLFFFGRAFCSTYWQERVRASGDEMGPEYLTGLRHTRGWLEEANFLHASNHRKSDHISQQVSLSGVNGLHHVLVTCEIAHDDRKPRAFSSSSYHSWFLKGPRQFLHPRHMKRFTNVSSQLKNGPLLL